jgi:hypothetical protein
MPSCPIQCVSGPLWEAPQPWLRGKMGSTSKHCPQVVSSFAGIPRLPPFCPTKSRKRPEPLFGRFLRSHPEKLAIRFQYGYIVGCRECWRLSWKPAQFTGIRAVDNGDE